MSTEKLTDAELSTPRSDAFCASCEGSGKSPSESGSCHVCKGTGQARPPRDIPMKVEFARVIAAERDANGLPPRIAFGLFNAQCSVGRIGNDAHNDDYNFDYTSSEAVVGRCGIALRAEGLLPLVISVEPLEERERLAVTVRLIHVESGQSWTSTREVALNTERNARDWAESGAETLALSYWFRGVLMFARGGADVNARGAAPSGPKAAPATSSSATSSRSTKTNTNAETVVNAFASEIQSTHTVVDFEVVAKRVRRAFGREVRRDKDQRLLNELLAEHRLVCEANDASALAEGSQGRAA